MSALALFLFACKPDVDLTVTDRAAGDRTPLSASCDPLDEVRCHLPWPSSTFTAVDSSTETGLRLAIDPSALESSNDDTPS